MIKQQYPLVAVTENHWAQDEMDVDGDWKEDGQISDFLRAKILSLKLCRHRCIAQAKSKSPMDIASPVFKMLTTLLQHDGLLSDKIATRYFLHHFTSALGDTLLLVRANDRG